MKIATLIGARPQFVKVAALSRAIESHNAAQYSTHIDTIVIHTGQHYDDNMSSVFFRDLSISDPDYNLGIGSGSHGSQTGKMLMAVESVLVREWPDWVIVFGDTNSTLAGALSASKLGIRVGHIEAGLRSFDRGMPEEINRVITDHLADLLLCPSETAVKNLHAEGITKGIHISGDVMADALEFALSRAAIQSNIQERLSIEDKSYLLATIHRAENTDDISKLRNILSAFESLDERIVFPVHPRTKKLLQKIDYHAPDHIMVIDPVGYLDMITLEKSARMILTDSGGVQKEAYWLEVPCVTLRDETEWVETVENGWNVLAGTQPDVIINAVRLFQRPSVHPPLYGDGKAAERCIKVLTEIS